VLGKLLEPEHWNKISSSGSSVPVTFLWNTNGTLEPLEPLEPLEKLEPLETAMEHWNQWNQ